MNKWALVLVVTAFTGCAASTGTREGATGVQEDAILAPATTYADTVAGDLAAGKTCRKVITQATEAKAVEAVQADGVALTSPHLTGTGSEYDPCLRDSDCQPGLSCVSNAGIDD